VSEATDRAAEYEKALRVAEWGNELSDKRRLMREESEYEVRAILVLAGIQVTRAWELANGYWPDHPDYDYCRRPWWLFQTDIGLLRLGWRKRVLEIDWSATETRAVVTKDEVTKSHTMCHAWSTEKAVEYCKGLKVVATKKGAEDEKS